MDNRTGGSIIKQLYISNVLRSIDYQISLQFSNITLNKVNGYFRYFCRMFMNICSVNHISLALLSLSVVELLQNRVLYLTLS